MFKVVRSYSKKAERKHESNRAASEKNGAVAIENGYGNYGNYGSYNGSKAVASALMAGGFSESSSYEAREHFERKVQRVKKTRSERERDRSRSLRRGDELDSITASDGGSARDALLQWARKTTEGYPRVNVTNFSSSWRDGLAFNAILHRYRPKAINWQRISDPSVSNRERLANAFDVAKREFDVDRLLDPEDVDVDHPDEKSVITYVSSLYNNLPHTPELSQLLRLLFDYSAECSEWRRWVERATELADDRLFIGSAESLLEELLRFREEDMPPRYSDLLRLVDIYEGLSRRVSGRLAVAAPAHEPAALESVWSALCESVSRRESLLRTRASSQGSLSDLISRLSRGIGITNEKLDIILSKIEDVEARVDSARTVEIERAVNDIVDDLNALESPIAGFFEDVDSLKQHQHPEANDFYRQVFGLHQRREAYLDRLTNQLLVKLGQRTETMRRKEVEQSEAMRKMRFGRVEECIEWVRIRAERLSSMEFVEHLETLEDMFEQHKHDNREIQDFRQEVDACIARQSEISAEESVEYCELLRVLESEYQQLRDLSAGRMLDLDSLIAFVRAAQMELVWVSEREEIEVHRNWSDIEQLDLPMLTNYYKQLLHEMELREPQFNDVHNKGAALLNQGHPAVHVIEVYIHTMKKQWDWLLNLSKCLEQHLRDALNLKAFMEEATDAEAWIKEQTDLLERSYTRSDFTLEEGERFLRELDEIKEILNKYQSVLHALSERCRTISPLWQRGERITRPIAVTALCDYEDSHISIRQGDDVTLIDNSDLINWQIQDVTGRQGSVPSVVFRIPPPDTRLTAFLTRLLQQFEKLRKLWDFKQRMVRFYMVLNTMKTIQGWTVDDFNAIDPEQRDAIIKALNDDANKLLSELDPNDPLAQRLRDELKKTMDHFWSLFNLSQRAPEQDMANEFDKLLHELLRKLEEAWRALKERTGRPIPRTAAELDKALAKQRAFEEALQGLDADVANLKELFSKLPNPSPTQRVNMERVNALWDDSWDLSRLYVERMKVQDSVISGITEVSDIVRAHEITLNSFDDLPAALDRLRGEHAQLIEINMVLQQQQTVVDQLNRNVALLRQHVMRTRLDSTSHPDVDRLEEEVQQLNVRWENVQAQVAERLKATERALQTQMVYRSEYENEMAWLDRVEDTINRLRKPEDLRPEQYQQQLDLLIAEYSQLQERTEAIENVNREGGKFIREAKGYDGRLKQYGDVITGIHGRDIARDFRRTSPQPKNGAQIVTEELELLNRRFAQLSSLILEKRNVMQVLIQNWKRQKQDAVVRDVMNRQAEMADLVSDLSAFQESFYTQHLRFDLNALRPEEGIESLKKTADEWARQVKEKLDGVDAMCVEGGGAESLSAEQFSALREARLNLERTYNNVLANIQGFQDRLNVVAKLLIEFNSRSCEMHSWITTTTRRAGELKASCALQGSDQARRDVKALYEHVFAEESTLKGISLLLVRIESEMEELYRDASSKVDDSERTLSSDDVRKAYLSLEQDYTDLTRLCTDLGIFEHRLASLASDADETLRRTSQWLANVEEELSDALKGSPEERLWKTERMQAEITLEERHLSECEQANEKLLSLLEGTEALPLIRATKEATFNDQKERHSAVLNKMRQSLNDALAEKAAKEEIKDAVGDLVAWSEDFIQRVGTFANGNLPLRLGDLEQLKNEEQILRSELERQKMVAQNLEKKIEEISVDDPSRDGGQLSQDIAHAKKAMARSNSALSGYRDNVQDALGRLASLNAQLDALGRNADEIGHLARGISIGDEKKLMEAETDLRDVLEQLELAENSASSLLSMPRTTKTQGILAQLNAIRHRVGALSREIEAKRENALLSRRNDELFTEKKEELKNRIDELEKDTLDLPPIAVNIELLGGQRQQCSTLLDQLSGLTALVEELFEVAETLSESNRAEKGRRQVAQLEDKHKTLGNHLKARLVGINEAEDRTSQFLLDAGEFLRWVDRQNKIIRSECPIPLTIEEKEKGQHEIERLSKDVRREQRKRYDEVMGKASELARVESTQPGAIEEIAGKVKELGEAWAALGDDIDEARDRLRSGENLQSKASSLTKWLAGQNRLLSAIGAPSLDASLNKQQSSQVELVATSMEDERSSLESFKLLAGDLARQAEDIDESRAKKIRSIAGDLDEKWKNLEEELAGKRAKLEGASETSSRLHPLLSSLKKDLTELETAVERTNRLNPTAQREALHSLDRSISGICERVGHLRSQVQVLAKEEYDPNHLSILQENCSTAKAKADELSARIAGIRAANESALSGSQQLEEDIDRLLEFARKQLASLESMMSDVVADPAKVDVELTKTASVLEELFSSDGEVAVLTMKASEGAAGLSEEKAAALELKLQRLRADWPRAMDILKTRKAKLDKVSDLLQQFTEKEENLKHNIEDDNEEIAAVLSSLSSGSYSSGESELEALSAIELRAQKRMSEAEELEKIASRLDELAPGADARKLKRQAENFQADAVANVKRIRVSAAVAARKRERKAKLVRLVAEARAALLQQKEELADAAPHGSAPSQTLLLKQALLADLAARTRRAINALAQELDQGSADGGSDVEECGEHAEIQRGYEEISDTLGALLADAEKWQREGERMKEAALSAAKESTDLCQEVEDSHETIGRSLDELNKNDEACDELDQKLCERESAVDEAASSLKEAMEGGLLSAADYGATKAAMDDSKRKIEKARRRLGQRRKRIDSAKQEIHSLSKESEALKNELATLASNPSLTGSLPSKAASHAEELRGLKNELRPLAERVSRLQAECHALIKSAPPETNTKYLASLIAECGEALAGVSTAVAEKEKVLDAAAHNQGKYEDSYKALMIWLEDAEEMLQNLQQPSADAKVARAQRHTYDVLLKHIEDKQQSVDGLISLMTKMQSSTSCSEEEKILSSRAAQIGNRYEELLQSALDAQNRLRDAADLAERYTAIASPYSSWLNGAEKRLNNLGLVSTDVDEVAAQLEEQKKLEEEMKMEGTKLSELTRVAESLSGLVSLDEATHLLASVAAFRRQHDSAAARCSACAVFLADVLDNLGLFAQELSELEEWVEGMERDMACLDDLAIHDQDELVEQANLLSELGVAVTEHEAKVADIIKTGNELCRQTTREEAIQLQQRVESLKMRFADVEVMTDEKLEQMELAIPLAERFHEGFESAMEWIEGVEDDLSMLEDAPLPTQLQIVLNIEEDVQQWRPDIDEVVAIGSQLQAMSNNGRAAQEMHSHTSDMNRRTNAIAEQVSRLAERLVSAERQSRVVVDDLQFLSEWMMEAKEKVSEASPPSIVTDYVRGQLKVQRMLNEDVATQRSRLRDIAGEARKLARQLGSQGGVGEEAVLDRTESARLLAKEVADICEKRTEQLEQALALSLQLEAEHDDLVEWIDEMEASIEQSPPVVTATPLAELTVQHKHNTALAAAISAQRPQIDRFQKDITSFQAICHPDDTIVLEDLKESVIGRINEIKENVIARGEALEQVMDMSNAVGERLDAFIAGLLAESARLQSPENMTADVCVWEGKMSEARALVDSISRKAFAVESLKERAEDVLAHAPTGDSSAEELAKKVVHMEALWKDLAADAIHREEVIRATLDKVIEFNDGLNSCDGTLDSLSNRLVALVPAVGQVKAIQVQTNELNSIVDGIRGIPPALERVIKTKNELGKIIPQDEKVSLDCQVDALLNRHAALSAASGERFSDLESALQAAHELEDGLSTLLDYLAAAEVAVATLRPLQSLPHEELPQELQALRAIKADLDETGLQREQLQMTANAIAEGARNPHDITALRQPLLDIQSRWNALGNELAERERAICSTLLDMGRLAETAQQMMIWVDKTVGSLNELKEEKGKGLRAVELARCKLALIRNDVHAHEASVLSLEAAAAAASRSPSSAEAESSIHSEITTLKTKWHSLRTLLNELATSLEEAKAEGEEVGGEMDRWLAWTEDMTIQLEQRPLLAVVVESAQQKIDDFSVTFAEVEQCRGGIEAFLRKADELSAEQSSDGSAEGPGWIEQNTAKLHGRWNKLQALLLSRREKLEAALERARQLESEIAEMQEWTDQTEKERNSAPPVSRLKDVLELQIVQNNAVFEEAEKRKARFMATKALVASLYNSTLRNDYIAVKNPVIALDTRLSKLISRIVDRSKQLENSKQEVEAWEESVCELNGFIDEVERKLAASPVTTSDVERLKRALQEAKEILTEMHEMSSTVDRTLKSGEALVNRAPKHEKKKLEKEKETLKSRWTATLDVADAKCSKAEKALLEGGRFMEAIQNSDDWLQAQLSLMIEMPNVRGDIDCVRELESNHSKVEEATAKKEATIQALLHKGRSLVAERVDESSDIEVAMKRIAEQWGNLKEANAAKRARLGVAKEEAEDVDAKLHALLDWLQQTDARLKGVPSETGTSAALTGVQLVMKSLEEEKPRLEKTLSAISALLQDCHPSAEPTLRNMLKVVEGRWKEVEQNGTAKAVALAQQEEREREAAAELHALNEFIERKRLELDEAMMEDPAQDVETAESRREKLDELEFELREKQPQVDAVTKGGKKHRNQEKRVEADRLAEKWRSLWVDAMAQKSKVEKEMDYLAEVKRLESWNWDDWRERYVEWNDHGKARVTDVFRRIARSGNGNVPRQAFIDAIIASKFPTSPLEMAKVANLFDKDGIINANDFINALKFGSARNRPTGPPKTEEEQKKMIKQEMNKRRDQCCCPHKFRIEQDNDGAHPSTAFQHRPGLRDRDGGVVQTYRFGDAQIKRMVRILHTTVMVRVGGGWVPLDEFLDKHDPCKSKGRTNSSLYSSHFYNDVRPAHATDNMYSFTKNRHSREEYAESPRVTRLRPYEQHGTPGPASKVREKTNVRSVPMFGENRFEAQRLPSNSSHPDDSRPASRTSSISETERPTRIPSLRGPKGRPFQSSPAQK